ncbi:MAG TPA: hypothetical protein PK208_07605 [Fibrobacteria bacterium]|nr:hypothetical protein [Fibrobacteria bacterium]
MRSKPAKSSKRRPTSPDISLDQAIKDLLTRYPVDAWRFLLPDLARKLGDPVSWETMRSETRKHDLKRKGYVMDLPIRYTFAGGRAVVAVVLIEHWATAKSVNLHRTAHYVLDLMEREPQTPVVPVALVTDLDPGEIPTGLCLPDLGGGDPVLAFRHRVQVVAHADLTTWRRRSNVVATVMTLAMGGKISKADKAWTAFLDLEKLVDAEEVMRLSPLVFRVGKLDEEQREVIMATKTKLPEPKFFQQLREDGKSEGERTKALESARKLLEHGIAWDIITDSTGVKPADLKKAAPATARKVAKK